MKKMVCRQERDNTIPRFDHACKGVRATVVLIWFVFILSQTAVLGLAQEDVPVPDWLNNLNPADYVLINSDLPSDLKVAGDIYAEAQAAETTLLRNGKAEVERVAFAQIDENICHPDPEGIFDCVGGNYLVNVYVYETPELARAAWENTIVEEYGKLPPLQGFDYVSNLIDPQDPRFDGKGNCVGPYILYANIACTIFGQWDEIDNKIASLWLDKVSKTEPVLQVVLEMKEDLSLILGYQYQGSYIGSDNYKPMREIAADQQAVQAQVFNAGEEVAENVYLQFYLQLPGQPEYAPLGDPILVGDVPPGEGRAADIYWDLKGENVEGAVLGAQAYVPGAVDVNPDDNFVSVTVNVYYAHNGQTAYSHIDDTYRFENYRFNDSEAEETTEELIATVAAGLDSSTGKDLWLRLFFPQTYERLWNYFNESYRSSAGGHCYGMAATSALYFQDPSLKPTNKKTYQMSLEEASQNIAFYHRAQMLPLVRSLLVDVNPYFNRGWGQTSYDSQYKTYMAVKNSLKEDRKPLMIEFGGRERNDTVYHQHAVLAYKLVEVEGHGEDYKHVYIYDSNSPISEIETLNQPMPVVTLWLDGVLYYSVKSGNVNYRWKAPRLIAANPVFRTIPLEEANALLPDLKKMVKMWIDSLRAEGKFAAVTRCPADAVFIDSQGRRTGTVDGKVIVEIPDSEVVASGEVEIYLLPSDLDYALEITGTGNGKMDLDIVTPQGESEAKVVSFQNVALRPGDRLSSELKSGGKMSSLRSGGTALSPSLVGTLDLGEVEGVGHGHETPTAFGESTGSVEEEDVEEKAVEELIFERNSLGGVENDPPNPTKFTLDRSYSITEIRTYHWNYGQGQTPGIICLQDSNDKVWGMWLASGQPGMGGVPDAYWSVRHNLELPPGEYTILDSDPATWSHNSDTGGEGIVWVYGYEVSELPYHGELLIDAPPGGWEGITPGEAI